MRYPDVPPCPCPSCKYDRRVRCEAIKELHHDRRNEGVAICHPTRKAYKGGRCRQCWKAKLASERKAYAAKAKAA